MSESLDATPHHIDAQTVKALDSLIDQTVRSHPNGYFQIWCYAQIEQGRVTQIGISPVIAQSIRFADRGRRR